MDVAYVSALSALAGSVVGGLISGLASWASQREQARAGLRSLELTRRQDLFKDFIVASSKVYGDALMSNEPQIPELVALYGMISRMRVLCTPRTVASAVKVLGIIVDTYFTPNKTVRELRDLVKTGTQFAPLHEFSEAAREELGTFNAP